MKSNDFMIDQVLDLMFQINAIFGTVADSSRMIGTVLISMIESGISISGFWLDRLEIAGCS